jgi:hypothetical protein
MRPRERAGEFLEVAAPVELEDPDGAAQPHPAGAHLLMKAVLEAILGLRVMLRPEIAKRGRAAPAPGARGDRPAVEPVAVAARLAVVRFWRRQGPTARGNAHGNGMATKWRFGRRSLTSTDAAGGSAPGRRNSPRCRHCARSTAEGWDSNPRWTKPPTTVFETVQWIALKLSEWDANPVFKTGRAGAALREPVQAPAKTFANSRANSS